MLKFKTNRVSRTYKGGKLLEDFKNSGNIFDSNKPEEWIGSTIIARNYNENKNNEGLSFINNNGEDIRLRELLKEDPNFYLGQKHIDKFGLNTALLVKLLDSAERLSIQVHPGKKDAKKYFNSIHGKTEAWYILNKRNIKDHSSCIWLGFKPGITEDKWRKMFIEQNVDEMLKSMHKFNVEPGDVYLIDGGIPHAIGAGCFLLEIQEPTDLTLRVEKVKFQGKEAPEELYHQGIGFDKMFNCFNYKGYTRDEILGKNKLKKKVKNFNKNNVVYDVITYEDTDCFSMEEYFIKKNYIFENNEKRFSIFIVISGKGEVILNGNKTTLNRGESYFLPAGVNKLIFKNKFDEGLKLLRCLPPKI